MIQKGLIFILLFKSFVFYAQADSKKNEKTKSDTLLLDKKISVFNTLKLINAQSVEVLRKRKLEIKFIRRFGNLYNESLNNSAHSFFGLDERTDFRVSLDYGITENVTIGIARSRFKEMWDATYKWKILNQNTNNKSPVSLCFYGNMGYSSASISNIYSGTIQPKTNEAHRLQYCSQLIIARKFNNMFSLQMAPTFVYRNFIKQQTNIKNGEDDTNGLFSLSFGGRVKLSKKVSLVIDYFYNFSHFQKNNPVGYYNVLGLGLEIIKNKRALQINFTNGVAILESSFVPNTQQSWTKSQVKIGFSISKICYL